jgi:hypothetical protein
MRRAIRGNTVFKTTVFKTFVASPGKNQRACQKVYGESCNLRQAVIGAQGVTELVSSAPSRKAILIVRVPNETRRA